MDAIAPTSTRRNACRVFEFNSHGTDVDPDIVFGIEKFVFIRRVMAKDLELQQVVTDIGRLYKEFGSHGIFNSSTDISSLQPAPQVGHPERRK